MKNNRKGFLLVVLIALFFIFTSIFLIFIIRLDNRITSKGITAKDDQMIKTIPGWQYRWGDSPEDKNGNLLWLDPIFEEGWMYYQFPGRPDNPDKFNSIWIRGTLPGTGNSKDTLRFRAPQQTVEVYLDGRVIYSYCRFDTAERVRTPGSIWHFIDLPPNYAGKTVYFRMHSPFPHYTGYFIEFAIAGRELHYLDIIKKDITRLICGVLFVVIGAAIELLQLFGARKWSDIKYLALTFAFFGGWNIADCSTVQLFIFAPVSRIYAANFFIFLMPVWLLIYIERSVTIKYAIQRVLLRTLWIMHLLLALTAFAADMSGLVSSLYFNKYLHILMAVSLSIVAITIINTFRRGENGILLFISGILILGITGLYDAFIMFYDTSPLVPSVNFSYIGMLYFLATLLINSGRKMKALYEELKYNMIENETNYKSLFTNMTDGFIRSRLEYAEDGRIARCTVLEANNAFAEQTGLSKESLIGSDIFSIFPELKASGGLNCCSSIDGKGAATDSAPKRTIMLGSKWYMISSFCQKNDYLSLIFSDVTVMKNAEETIRRQVYIDGLTGFFNRRYFEDVMAQMNNKMDELRPLSIIAIDMDGLKITNDTFGHDAGDNLLKRAADILTGIFAENTVIARTGGDEFCVILLSTDNEAVQEKLQQIAREIHEYNKGNPVVPLSMSVGAATSNAEDEDMYNIYRRADDDMYLYKISQVSSKKSRVVDMLLTALSERDYVSQGHVERISELCVLLADALNLRDSQKRNLILLSKVHDLGKIGIPDEILYKQGRLTQNEFERMKLHVRIGYNIASRSYELMAIAPLILHHHEHWNGKGYPDSLKGKKIPLECRIISIIDAFDAMTNDRPYHKGISVEEAVIEIERCSGKQFDPFLAKKFINIIKRRYGITARTRSSS